MAIYIYIYIYMTILYIYDYYIKCVKFNRKASHGTKVIPCEIYRIIFSYQLTKSNLQPVGKW
jgi:hypothetical protein